MSGFTLDGITQAIQAHIDDETVVSTTVVSFVVAVHASSFEADDPEVPSYWFETPSHQSAHVTAGLIKMAEQWTLIPLERPD